MTIEYPAFKLRDDSGNPFGIKLANGKPRISSMPYTYDIAEGNVSGHSAFAKIGFTFYPFSEVVASNTATPVEFSFPEKIVEKVDLKISGIATVAGTASCVVRGWLETN